MGSEKASPDTILLVFARQFDRGTVKSRLAATIGVARARAIYRALAETVWTGCEDPRWHRWLMVEPADAVADAGHWLTGADRVLGQSPGDLGLRMETAFETAFAAGAGQVLVIGTDTPELNAARIAEARARLEEADGVLVPALDGGYALLGLKAPHPSLFRDIVWSTPEVAQQTRRRARAEGLVLLETDPVRDLDTESDLLELRSRGWDPGL